MNRLTCWSFPWRHPTKTESVRQSRSRVRWCSSARRRAADSCRNRGAARAGRGGSQTTESGRRLHAVSDILVKTKLKLKAEQQWNLLFCCSVLRTFTTSKTKLLQVITKIVKSIEKKELNSKLRTNLRCNSQNHNAIKIIKINFTVTLVRKSRLNALGL